MKIRQIMTVAGYNFRQWHKNSRIVLTFCLGFVMCFLLSDKAVRFAEDYGTVMQIWEPFIWTFGDADSILLSSLLLLLLFADMPFIGAGTPLYLMRIDRRTWVAGQLAYIVSATFFYLLFLLASTSLVSMRQSFVGDMWSETAAILGYSGTGQMVALPAMVKTLERSTPYECAATIFLLMSLYTLLLASLMLLLNLRKGPLAGVIGVSAFSLYGFLLDPQTIKALFGIPNKAMYRANVLVGWLSPLNHATYHMHSFGYDLLPSLGQTCLVFGALIALCFVLSLRAARGYNFTFTGTEESG